MIFCPSAWRTSRERKSMNTGAMNCCLNTRNCRCPLLEIAEITLAPNRCPVPSITGVCPTGLQDLPAVWSERNPISSAHRIRRFLAVARALDRGVALLKPPLDRLGVLLERAPGGLLRAEPPRRADTAPRSSPRHGSRTAARSARTPAPASTGTPAAELVRVLLPDRLRDLRLLRRRSARSSHPAAGHAYPPPAPHPRQTLSATHSLTDCRDTSSSPATSLWERPSPTSATARRRNSSCAACANRRASRDLTHQILPTLSAVY